MTKPPIGHYERLPVQLHDWTEDLLDAAARLIEMIGTELPGVTVDHVGSTSVPGLRGKGIIDLSIETQPGRMDAAKERLQSLGFAKQAGPDPFPEDRPLRIGSIEHAGRHFRIHAHVTPVESGEAEDMRRFRDALRQDPGLQRAYVADKERIIAEGILDGVEYARAKGYFVRETIGLPPES